jgi:hypothetical protein
MLRVARDANDNGEVRTTMEKKLARTLAGACVIWLPARVPCRDALSVPLMSVTAGKILN